MKSKKIVIGNWKMNPGTLKEAEKLMKGVHSSVAPFRKVDIVACPPSLYVSSIKKLSRKVKVGVQNIYPGDTGSFTGELSSQMVADMKIGYVIIGHSERRAMGEDGETINQKLKSAISKDLTPILCVGELDRTDTHEYLNFVENQLNEALDGLPKNALPKIIFAYEPVWAIGKNATRVANAGEFLEMSIFIKKVLSDKFNINSIDKIQVIYGGSVNAKNASEFFSIGQADGFLVGRASLDPEVFAQIVRIADNANN